MNALTSLLAKLDDGVKIAADTAQPPQEGHPTDHIDDHVNVPTGDTVTTAADDQVDRLGQLAAGATNAPTNDKEKIPQTMQTQVLDGTSSPSELTPGEGLEDPGPDSSHPASPNKNEKYASMNSAQQILAEMNKVANFTRGQLSVSNTQATAAAKTPAAPAAKTAGTPATAQSSASAQPATTNKYAAALNELIPTDKRDAAVKLAMATIEPFVAEGIALANKVANFMAAAEQDPAAAAAMMGGGGDPMAGGGDPMAGGGDPMAGAGAPPMDAGAGAAGGDPIQALVAQIQQVAQQLQVSPEELMMALAGGGGGGGGDAGGGAGGPPPAPGGGDSGPPSAAPSDSAPKDSSSSEGGSSAKSEEKDEKSEESKEAAAPNSKSARARKIAALHREVAGLLEEVDA